MHKLLLSLRPLVLLNHRYPYSVLALALLLALFSGYYAVKLQIDTDIASLLPESNENVQALRELQRSVGGETVMQVAIRSSSFEANSRFADDLIERSLQLYDESRQRPFINRAEFRRDTEILRDNALYLATFPELEEISSYLEEEIQLAREEANPFFVDFLDDFDDEGEAEETEPDLDQFRQLYDDLIPSEYPVNADSTLLLLEMYPSGSQSDIGYLEDLFRTFDELIVSLEPTSYHPEMEVRFGGRLKRHLNELESIMNDVFNSFATGISSVVLLVLLYFFLKKYFHYRQASRENQQYTFWAHLIRAPVPILVIGVPLLISLSWTFGIVYLALGTLNTMTSVLFVILFGLGIDYGIHYYARYIELRSDGMGVKGALLNAYEKTGMAIVVSAITTAAALYVLMAADFRGFSEFGFIAGTGILLALFCMLFIMPALLTVLDRQNWVLLVERSADGKVKPFFRRYPYVRTIVAGSILISAVVLFNSHKLEFEYEFDKLEPDFPEYTSFREFSSGVDQSDLRNPAYIVAESNEDLFEIVDILRERKQSNPNSMIHSVEALQERFPVNRAAEQRKLEAISEIRSLLRNSFLVDQQSDDLDLLRRASQTEEPLALSQIPEYLLNRFINQEGEIGRFVIIYPNEGLADGRRSIAFKNEIGEVEVSGGRVYHAASTSIVAAEMLDLMIGESPYMVAATFLIVLIFMFYSFRSFRWGMIAMIPLIVGLLFLFGVMLLTGFKFNFYNLVVLPAILGIGCDNGVHIAHRYRNEGKDSMWNVLSSTGQHITVGSLTTMLGFTGLLFTAHPGLQSIGIMALTGIGLTLFTALTLLPALVQLLEKNGWMKY